MREAAELLAQRSRGSTLLRMERGGPTILREEGAAKCRLPRGSQEAILINTSGGLAGGDHMTVEASVGMGARLTLTTQAAERVYRTLGPAADVEVILSAEEGASLFWLPQETIFFEGSALRRRLDVTLAAGATFLAVETMVFGRKAMGETLRRVRIRDSWSVRRADQLIHAEALALGPDLPESAATLGGAGAAATLLCISKGLEDRLPEVRAALGPRDGASAWNGKLIARILGDDSLAVRKTLVCVLSACVGSEALPKVWTF